MRKQSRNVVLFALLAVFCFPVVASEALSRSASLVARGDYKQALQQLREQFKAGYPTPADVLSDPRFSALRETPDVRGEWRELMGEYVRESRIAMVTPDEPGKPMLIKARLRNSSNGAPVAGALVHLYQTDATGNYEPGRPAGDGSNPRLFGWVRTDQAGRFEVQTIAPRHYPGSGPAAAHVHYRISAEGFRSSRDEFRPYTSPANRGDRETAQRRGQPTSIVSETKGGLLCEVSISLDPGR